MEHNELNHQDIFQVANSYNKVVPLIRWLLSDVSLYHLYSETSLSGHQMT